MRELAAPTSESVSLDYLGVIAARGSDSRTFLQGQLSQELLSLGAGDLRLAGYHTPQGRVLAVLRLLSQGENDVLMLLPRELAAGIAARMARYVLRAKTRISDESALWTVLGHIGDGPGRMPWAERFVSLERREATVAASSLRTDLWWHTQDIAQGLPQVYAASSEQFVAQMLNLDVLGAIAFNKGCYTGQEIIARAHYRGRIKRRMQRFESDDPQPLVAGERVTLSDGRAAQIVDAVALSADCQQLLAITTLPAAATATTPSPSPSPTAADSDVNSDTVASTESAAHSRPIEANPLPLPYTLPV